MRLVWLTDIHLDFCDEGGIAAFLEALGGSRPDAVLVGGDTGKALSVLGFLRRIRAAAAAPVYFVLGNHDFYGGSIARVRAEARAEGEGLTWLSGSGTIEIAAGTGLLGHDGWADGRLGDYDRSPVVLNDFHFIRELRGLGSAARLALLQRLAGEAAAHLGGLLPEALERFRQLIVLTHVPPFDSAAWHEGRMCGPHYLPFFASKAVGDVLREAMLRRPDREMLVLCGHTHGGGVSEILPNLRVRTGGAEYMRPEIQEVMEIGDGPPP